MTKYISLVFNEDLHRDEIQKFKQVHGCVGVSGYRDTLNMYFKEIDRVSLISLSRALQEAFVRTGVQVILTNTTLDSNLTRHAIYEALQEEVAI